MELFHLLKHIFQIIGIVFVLMILIEYFDLKTRGKIRTWLEKGQSRQYLASSLLGASPGCVGAFGAVTLYTHGFLSLGSIVAAMVATSGDGAFVMLAMFPRVAVGLFALLFIIGIFAGFATDKISNKFGIEKCEGCRIKRHFDERGEKEKLTVKHFFKSHVYAHIVKKHLPKIVIWVAGGLFFIQFLNSLIGLESLLQGLPVVTLLIVAVIIGLIPGSSPNIPFVLLFSTGAIPFSVLLANSIVQDGHGLFPLLSFTVRDSVIVKVFNAGFGFFCGLVVAILLGW